MLSKTRIAVTAALACMLALPAFADDDKRRGRHGGSYEHKHDRYDRDRHERNRHDNHRRDHSRRGDWDDNRRRDHGSRGNWGRHNDRDRGRPNRV